MATRSEEIEREIEETRRDMTRTVDAIERRLSPDSMIDGAMSWIRTNPKGQAVMEDVGTVISRNPLPIVLIGIGLGWLAWEMTQGGRRTVRRYRPMRERLGPNVPAERHHMHVEDGGSSAYGRSPDPGDLVGYRSSGQSARDAAEAFRDLEDRSVVTGTGPYRPGRSTMGPNSGLSAGGFGTGTGTGTPRAGEVGGPGYGPSVGPRSLGGMSGGTSAGVGGAGNSSPSPEQLTGYNRSGEKAADAAKAFEQKPGDSTPGQTSR